MEASAVNQPHPDDAADAFFGGADVPDTNEDTPLQSAPLSEEQAAAEAAEYRKQHGEPEPEPEPTPEPTAAADPPAAGSTTTEKARGALEREYIVFQRVPLTEKALRHLLSQIEAGKSPQPRLAYFELHRAVTRNDKQAIAAAHTAHRESLGETCDLAAVSSRSFKERHVEPEEVPAERRLRIT